MAMLGPFTEIGYALIPLHIGAKTPAHTGWQTRDYTQFDFKHWLAVGGNVGFRLAATDLVISSTSIHAISRTVTIR